MAKKPQFYFISEQYYIDFPDDKLMKNKPSDNGISHQRPFFFAFPDKLNPNIFWMVPVSSQYQKYQSIAQKRLSKYGVCDSLQFGKLFKRDHVFLIQNMCPVTEKYLTPYLNKYNQPICIDGLTAANIIKSATSALNMAKYQGKKIFYPDVFKIYKGLEEQSLHAQPQTTF